jgi:glycine/D-amino acid oxidase-like deaminating enzyme
MNESFDVVVVGGGIVGAACSDALSAEGARVLLLDAGFVGGGSTAAGMGHLVHLDDDPVDLALTRYSIRLWEDLLTDAPPEIEHARAGTLWIAANDADLALAHAKQGRLARTGIAARVLSERDLREREPLVRPGLAGALFVPDDHVIYPPAAARWLVDRSLARGAQVREQTRVTRIEPGLVTSATDRWSCEAIVVAAGCATPDLVEGIPVVPRRGHLAITQRTPGFCRHQLVELGYHASTHVGSERSVAFNVQPRGNGQLLIGSSREFAGLESGIHRVVLRDMLARAVSFMPSLAGVEILRTWTGFRPASLDGRPFIGPMKAPGVWVATGHEGLGITTSIGTARLLADLMMRRTPAIDPSPYDPSRGKNGSLRAEVT